MKCLYISYDGVLEPLGQSQIIPYLKGLSRKGISFVLLTFDKKYYMDKKEVHRLSEDLHNTNIKWLSLRYHKRPPVVSTIFDIMQGMIVSVIIALREKLVVVHARGYAPSLVALLLKKIFKIKYIFDMRGFWTEQKVESKHWHKDSPLYRFTKYCERKFITNADEIVVLTKQAKEAIENYGYASSKNISVIPCCVNVSVFKSDAKIRTEMRAKNNLDGKMVFAHTGSFETGYIKDELLDYFKTAKRIIPNAHFLILTRYSKDEILKLIVKKQLKTDDFTITSSSFDQMPKYLSMVDVGMLFLSLGFSKKACSPTKFAEFLSCGIPVISTSKIGDIEEVIVNNRVGVIVNYLQEDEYKQTLIELLKLLDDENLKSRCRQLAEKEFSLELGVDRYYSIYTKL